MPNLVYFTHKDHHLGFRLIEISSRSEFSPNHGFEVCCLHNLTDFCSVLLSIIQDFLDKPKGSKNPILKTRIRIGFT